MRRGADPTLQGRRWGRPVDKTPVPTVSKSLTRSALGRQVELGVQGKAALALHLFGQATLIDLTKDALDQPAADVALALVGGQFRLKTPVEEALHQQAAHLAQTLGGAVLEAAERSPLRGLLLGPGEDPGKSEGSSGKGFEKGQRLWCREAGSQWRWACGNPSLLGARFVWASGSHPAWNFPVLTLVAEEPHPHPGPRP